jgi:hypothetical protein
VLPLPGSVRRPNGSGPHGLDGGELPNGGALLLYGSVMQHSEGALHVLSAVLQWDNTQLHGRALEILSKRVSDLKKACLSQIHLFDELSRSASKLMK